MRNHGDLLYLSATVKLDIFITKETVFLSENILAFYLDLS